MRIANRIAAVTKCFHQPLKKSLRTAQELGFAGVQLDAIQEIKPAEFTDSAKRQFLLHLRELGLAVASLNVPARKSLYHLDDLDNRIDTLKQTMRFAFQLQSKTVTSRVGQIPEDTQSPEYQTLLSVLNDLARHANHVGAVLAITPSGDDFQSLEKLLSGVTEGPIGLHLDPTSLIASGQQPARFFEQFADYVLQIQIRDALRDMDGGVQETPVGRGEVIWDEFLVLIHSADYPGWLTVERQQGNDKQNDMVRAMKFVRNILPQ
ncbi:MAG: hypothetical protein Tsb009_30150 [Planctomycetaceae bacterium]